MFFHRMMTRAFYATNGVRSRPLTLPSAKITRSDPSLCPELRVKQFINSNLNFLISGIESLVPGGPTSVRLNSPFGVNYPEFSHQTYLGRNCCNIASFSVASTLILESSDWDIRVIVRKQDLEGPCEINHVHIQLAESTGIFSSDPIIVDPTWRGLLIAEPPRSIFRGITPAWKQTECVVNSQLLKPPYDMPIFVGRKSELIQLVKSYIQAAKIAHPELRFRLPNAPLELLWDGSDYTYPVKQYVERLRKVAFPPYGPLYHLIVGSSPDLLREFIRHLISAELIPQLPAPSNTIVERRSLTANW